MSLPSNSSKQGQMPGISSFFLILLLSSPSFVKSAALSAVRNRILDRRLVVVIVRRGAVLYVVVDKNANWFRLVVGRILDWVGVKEETAPLWESTAMHSSRTVACCRLFVGEYAVFRGIIVN